MDTAVVDDRCKPTQPPKSVESDTIDLFVEFIGANLGDILCERFEPTAGNDNCVRFNALSLQIPATSTGRYSRQGHNKRTPRYGDGTLAIFHGPSGPLQCSRQGD